MGCFPWRFIGCCQSLASAQWLCSLPMQLEDGDTVQVATKGLGGAAQSLA
jgi:hypothetical protein